MRVIYVVVLLLVFVGCKSKQRLSVQTDVKTEFSEQKDIKESESQRRDSLGQRETEIKGNKESSTETTTITTTKVYDTDKPVDETGRRPIKEETVITTTTRMGDRETFDKKQKEGSAVSDEVVKTKEDKSFLQGSTDTTENVRETKIKSVFRVPWLWIVVGLIGGFGVWFWVRNGGSNLMGHHGKN